MMLRIFIFQNGTMVRWHVSQSHPYELLLAGRKIIYSERMAHFVGQD